MAIGVLGVGVQPVEGRLRALQPERVLIDAVQIVQRVDQLESPVAFIVDRAGAGIEEAGQRARGDALGFAQVRRITGGFEKMDIVFDAEGGEVDSVVVLMVPACGPVV